MARVDDLSRSLVAFDQDSTLVVVVEMSESSWVVAGLVPGVARNPLKKLAADREALLRLVGRWRAEAVKAGRTIGRVVVAYEAGRDGFWLARWLRAGGIEAHVIHPTSVAVSREHKRAKTDRLNAAMLLRALLGWLRGEAKHCAMAAIPTLEEEDAKRPSREREALVKERTRIVNRMKAALARLGIGGVKPELRRMRGRLATLRTAEGAAMPPNTLAELERDQARLAMVQEQIKAVEKSRLQRLTQAPDSGPPAMVRLLARVLGVGVETADIDPRGDVPPAARREGGGALRRAHRLAQRERRPAPRERPVQGRQCPAAAWPDPARLASAGVPEGKRPGAVVPGADRRRRAQVHGHRRAGPQDADRAVAHGQDRRGARGPRLAAGRLSRPASRHASAHDRRNPFDRRPRRASGDRS
jgi:transposase